MPLPEDFAAQVDKKYWFGHKPMEVIIANVMRELVTTVRDRVKACPHQPGGCEACWGLE